VLCGPAPMLKAAQAALHGLGVPRARILAERFTYD
jgi:ferredoxin-NADP reductase